MIVLLTGHRGRLGPAIIEALARAGHEVRGFDLADGGDIRDAAAIARAARGAQAIVHAAGLADDRNGSPADLMSINVLGTWNVLLAAEANRIARVVYGALEPKAGIVQSQGQFFTQGFLNHRVLYEGGVLAQECGAVLTEFFRARRAKSPSP